MPDRWDYWQLTRDEPLILEELAAYREAGGSGARRPDAPRRRARPDLARRDRQVDPGCTSSWAAAGIAAPTTRPRRCIDRRSVDDLADELVREATEGVGDTGIRPGIIGEIGTDKPWVSALEERVHRAAARAARRTGLAITTHGVLSAVGLDQLRIFEDEGADPARVVIGHADSFPRLDHYLAIVERGASLEFDFLGMSFTPSERLGEGRIVELLCDLLGRGHVERILLSQDVCHDSQLSRYGGNGYTYLARTFLPRLREAGVGEAEIDTMTVANPRRMLAIG